MLSCMLKSPRKSTLPQIWSTLAGHECAVILLVFEHSAALVYASPRLDRMASLLGFGHTVSVTNMFTWYAGAASSCRKPIGRQ